MYDQQREESAVDVGRSARLTLDDIAGFADQHGLTIERALDLVEQYGNDASILEAAAVTLKARFSSH